MKSDSLETPDVDLDTGKPTRRDEYPLADATYRELLDNLAYNDFREMDDPLRDDLVQFYDGYGFPKPSRLDKCGAQRWRKTFVEVTQVRADALLESLSSSTRQARIPDARPRRGGERNTVRPSEAGDIP